MNFLKKKNHTHSLYCIKMVPKESVPFYYSIYMFFFKYFGKTKYSEMSIFWFCWEFVYLRFWTSTEWLKSRIIVDISFENDIDLISNVTPYEQIKNVNILCSLYLSSVLTQIIKKKVNAKRLCYFKS